MKWMFDGATAFNQALAFNTARVTDVRVYLFGVWMQLYTRFWFLLSNLLIIRCRNCFILQKPSTNPYLSILLKLQMWEYTGLLRNETTDSNFRLPTQFIIRCSQCLKVQRLSISHYLSTLPRLQLWEQNVLVWSRTAMRDQILISYFLCNLHQMDYMFGSELSEYEYWYRPGTGAFNQPLSFDTAEVTTVRVYTCLESNYYEKADSHALFPIQLITRWKACLWPQQPSISNYLSILSRLQMWEYTCFEYNRYETPADSPFSTQLNIQMQFMFSEAEAFNQPLAFDTAKVTDVRAYICLKTDSNDRPDSDFLSPIQHLLRCRRCSLRQKPSINR